MYTKSLIFSLIIISDFSGVWLSTSDVLDASSSLSSEQSIAQTVLSGGPDSTPIYTVLLDQKGLSVIDPQMLWAVPVNNHTYPNTPITAFIYPRAPPEFS